MSDDDAPPADPDELDFTRDERVAEIDEGRYVVGTDGRPNVRGRGAGADAGAADDAAPADDGSAFTAGEPKRPAEREPTTEDPAPAPSAGAGAGGQAGGQGGSANAANAGTAGDSAVDAGAVSRWLASSFDDDGFRYGFDATLHAEGDTSRHRMVSNDVTATFDTLVSWFAMNAGREAAPAEALGLLLVAADTPVQYPEGALKRYVARKGLSPDDSIGDLLRAVEADGGLRLDD